MSNKNKHKIGRPIKSEDSKATEFINFRTVSGGGDILKQHANEVGISVSEYIRLLTFDEKGPERAREILSKNGMRTEESTRKEIVEHIKRIAELLS